MGTQAQGRGREGRGGKGREAHGSVFLVTVHGSRFTGREGGWGGGREREREREIERAREEGGKDR